MGRWFRAGDADAPVWLLLRIALPLALSVGCFSLTMFIDRTLLFRFDPEAAAAALAAGNVYWTLACLPVAAVGFASTIVARHYGANELDRIGPVVWQTVWLAIAFVPFFAVAACFAKPLFHWMGHASSLAALETRYFRLLMTVPPSLMIEAGLFAFFTGRGRTQNVLLVNVVTCLLNLGLDLLLIFGWGPIPAMGIQGAAIATSVSMWFRTLFFTRLVLREPMRRHFNFADAAPRFGLMATLMTRGTSLGFHQVLRSAVMSAFVVQLGVAGAETLAAATVVLSWHQLVAMPLIGLGTAVTVLTGQQSGADNGSAPQVLRSGLLLAVVYSLPIGSLFVFASSPVVDLFAGEGETVGVQTIRNEVSTIALWGGLYLLFDAVNQIVGGFLRGEGRTHSLFVILLVTSAIYAGGFTMISEPTGPWLWGGLVIWSATQFGLSLWAASRAKRTTTETVSVTIPAKAA